MNSEVLRVVQEIKVPVYIGTNQDPLRTGHIENMVGQYFRGVFSSCNIGHIKPEAELYLFIEQALQLNPNQITLVDDAIENVDGAINRGWNAFYYKDNIKELNAFLISIAAV